MARILVTAALGNVGQQVVTHCIAAGLPLRVGGRSQAALAQQFPGCEGVALDFLDRRTWAPALAGCTAVFLLRPPPLGDMQATLCPFVDAAYAAGVGHILFLSVAGAERMQWVPHYQVERHLQAGPPRWTVLRPGFFAQNLTDAYRRDIREDDRIYVPAGAGRVAFIDVDDIGAVAARILSSPAEFSRQALTLTGAAALSFAEVAALLSRELGRPIRYQPASLPGYIWHLRRHRQLPWMQVAVQSILHLGLRRGDAEQVDPTTGRLLGRPPRTLADSIHHAAATWAH